MTWAAAPWADLPWAGLPAAGTTITTVVGNATAAGQQAGISVNITVAANTGNATADGLQATITQADELPLIVGGFWEEQWRRIRERERKRQESPQALIERVEEQIAEVAQVLEVPRPATVNVERVLVDLQLRAQQLELAADRVRVVQRLIAEAQALQAEIEEEEDLLMLL